MYLLHIMSGFGVLPRWYSFKRLLNGAQANTIKHTVSFIFYARYPNTLLPENVV